MLRPSTYAVLRRMSKVSRQSMSQCCGELLDAAGPILSRMADVMEAAQAAQGAVKERFQANLEEAHRMLENELQLVLPAFEDYTGDLVTAAERIERRARRGAPARGRAAGRVAQPEGGVFGEVDPPPLTGGVHGRKGNKIKGGA